MNTSDDLPFEEPKPPMLRVIRGGQPTDEELAALVAVVAASAAGGGAPEPEPLRKPMNAWVASGLVKGTRTKV
jgi:hypothetical protein